MDRSVFNKFRTLIYDRSGITLGPGKEALVSARIGKRMRALAIDDYRDYLKYVTQDESGDEVINLLDVVSTNVTSFFRESKHFDFLGEIVEKWAADGQKRMRFWSAACSTGEEPYTIAMTLLAHLDQSSVDIRILATDLSTRVLQKCREGIYAKNKIETVPPVLRHRYFLRQGGSDSNEYAVADELKEMIALSRINLAEPPYPMKGPFDAIFCRNVMIYFDNEVRQRLVGEIYRLLKRGGYLMVGHAESLTGIANDFKSVAPSVYIKE